MRRRMFDPTPEDIRALEAREHADEMKRRIGAKVGTNKRLFGRMPDGTAVEEITLLDTASRAVCRIITYGGAVRSLEVPDQSGNLVDVVLGFDMLEDYIAQDKYIGALVGRYANRIGGAKFTLNGEEYKLAANDGENSLHGGNTGFNKQVWIVEELAEDQVTLSLFSPDMQEGYPGNLMVKATYRLHDSALEIRYWAWCDTDTVFNPTSHIYFNLSGHDSGSVTGQHIRLLADRYTPTVPGSIPTGELADVAGTPMDLRTLQPIGEHIEDEFDQLRMARGYDHNWVLLPADAGGDGQAGAESPETGIYMQMNTSMPGVQFYAGNFLGGCPAGKGGAVYGDRCGFCLEAQFFPDSPNRPQFPSCVLKAEEDFYGWVSYRFYPSRAAAAARDVLRQFLVKEPETERPDREPLPEAKRKEKKKRRLHISVTGPFTKRKKGKE